MTALLTDGFNDTDNTALPSHAIAPVNGSSLSWVNNSGSWVVKNNAATIVAPAQSTVLIATVDSGLADCVIVASMVCGIDSHDVSASGWVFRYVDDSNYWVITSYGILYEFTAGSGTQRAGLFDYLIHDGELRTVVITLSGTSISYTLDYSRTYSYTSSVRQTATKHGLRMYEGGAYTTADSFPLFQVRPTSPALPSLRDWSGLTRYASNPIIPGNDGTWDAKGVGSPDINQDFKVGGTYNTFLECDGSDDAWNNIARYTSTDLTTWTGQGYSNPVITHSAGQWDDNYLSRSSIIKIGSTYYIYYSARNAAQTVYGIGRASSTDLQTWTKDAANPLFTGGLIPTIIKLGSIYYIYFWPGQNTNFWHTIWVYKSLDGLAWYPSHVAMGAQTGDWDATEQNLGDPYPYINQAGNIELLYEAALGSPIAQKAGYAISDDGFSYRKKTDAPILTGSGTGGAFDEVYIGVPRMVEANSAVYLFYTGVPATPPNAAGLALLGTPTSAASVFVPSFSSTRMSSALPKMIGL